MRSFRILLGLLAVVVMSGLACAAVAIDIDLSSQTMHVATGDGQSWDWPISSGREGHLTPRGHFRPLRLFPIVYSSKYNHAPMPHSIFFHGQYAIHGTTAVGALGHPASHGCVRLAPANAAILYARVRAEGATITIHGGPPRGVGAGLHDRRRHPASALGYAPRRRARSLMEWIDDPVGNR
ncbi:MAG: L,D-transpeptidase [Roseiarcus sp.]|jgi:L,D-transpeptidase-like protein